MSILSKPVNFIKEVRTELGKVSWSTRKELLDSTVVVIAFTTIVTIFIGLVDIILSKLLSVLIK